MFHFLGIYDISNDSAFLRIDIFIVTTLWAMSFNRLFFLFSFHEIEIFLNVLSLVVSGACMWSSSLFLFFFLFETNILFFLILTHIRHTTFPVWSLHISFPFLLFLFVLTIFSCSLLQEYFFSFLLHNVRVFYFYFFLFSVLRRILNLLLTNVNTFDNSFKAICVINGKLADV